MPAVAIASATRPDQQQVSGLISDIPALAETLTPGAPVIVVIGRVARPRMAGGSSVIPFRKTVAAS